MCQKIWEKLIKKHLRNKNTPFLISVFTTIASLSLFIWCNYGYPDARYVKDNYVYLCDRLNEVGIETANMHFYDPLPVNLYRLHYYTESWTIGYLQSVVALDVKNPNAIELKSNPYDTLSRLFLEGYTNDVQDVYNDIMYCVAACSDDFVITPESFLLWQNEREVYRIKALEACSLQAQVFLALLALSIMSLMMNVILFPRKEKEVGYAKIA